MATGIFFILSGIVILLYPQILVVLIATFSIAVGMVILAVSWHFRRLRKHSSHRVVDWIIRY